MEKKRFIYLRWEKHRKFVLVHFLTFFLLLVLLPCMASVHAQDKINIDVRKESLKDVFAVIQNQCNVRFLYSTEDVRLLEVQNLKMKNAEIRVVLDAVLKGTGLSYRIENDIVLIKKVVSENVPQQHKLLNITGIVKDGAGEPIPGAAVMVKGTSMGVTTDADGKFSLNLPERKDIVLIFSFVGMVTKEIPYSGQKELSVVMAENIANLEEVVVTGIVSRKSETYTGSAVTIKAEDLKRVGNQNIFQSLKNLDPSIFIMDNMAMGSDPNSLPEMNMRGGTSFSENLLDVNLKGNYQNKPNQPLFILDGFEASAEKIFDLDMNTVESLTILKDASAKALYGSKAANGVVVIETKRLNALQPRVTYTGSFDLTMPDLSSYNLCHSLEKLDVEFREGVYDDDDPASLEKYYDLRQQALEGLDTYWLSKPLRTGFGQKHSLNIELGKDELRTIINFAYNEVLGVMKGSDRVTTSGSVNVAYRFKHYLRLQNNASIASNKSADSPFGSFSQYAVLNPYERVYDENGNVRVTFSKDEPNPYYDGLINTKFTSEYTEFTNNTNLEFTPLEGLTLRGRLGITLKNNNADKFYPVNHSKFFKYEDEDIVRKGSYQVNNGKSKKFSGDVYVNYSRAFGKHNFLLNAGINWADNVYREEIHYAEGFPSDKMGDIMFALQYALNSRPTGISGHDREFGGLALLSYTYDDRFLSDFTFRTNASSMFGNNNRWAPFWSFGIGWNFHKEKFMESAAWVEQLKIRGSIGSTGNQNFQTNKSLAINEYYKDDRYTGLVGSSLGNMENPNLQWEQKMDYNAGFDAIIAKINLRFDIYKSITQNMVTSIAIAPSTGFSTVSDNLGKVENKGYELYVSYMPVRHRDGFLNLSASIAHNTNKIVEISDAMRKFNQQQEAEAAKLSTNAPVLKYQDGMDMNAIWAVPSYGIDPAIGIELLKGKDGKPTYIWKASDMQPLGTTSPKIRGNFGINGEYKGIGLSVTCTFLAGGQMYNQTLVDKVENAKITSNFDRRVLTERWSEPGQKAFFKRNSGKTPYDMRNGIYWYSQDGWSQEATRATGRFVQDRNELSISSVNLYYDFNRKWISAIGMQRLKASVYMNDVAKFSSIGIERGTAYPFARTLSFSLTGTF